MIPLTPVESSQIHAVGFDSATGTLAIQFKAGKTGVDGPGSVYHYANFDQDKFDAFKNAESLGRHFGAVIKNNPDFPHTKIVADDEGAKEAA